MTKVALISHPDCGRHDTGWGHPEHVGRLRAIPRALRDDPELFAELVHHEARHATPNEVTLAHDAAYVERVRALSEAGGGALDADTVVSEGSWDAARAATGAVLDGVDMVFDGRARHSFAAIRPPGHHALRARGMGFCLFGSVAIAAHYARARHGIQRVLIADWDVHHGNGTQALVEHEAEIRFVSMHQWPWYPGTGPASDRGPFGTVWNLPMPAGLEAGRYVDAFVKAIDAATSDWTPELVLVSSGFDSMAGDPLGGFTLEIEDVRSLTRDLVDRANTWCSGRLVSSLEGGYAPARLGEGVVAHLRAML
ncbi:MAG TPA: histone deacetylase [Gemmatimonadaceae bacterium]|nr:histone deacetylase [Gemmatimonadaceae bacterium]